MSLEFQGGVVVGSVWFAASFEGESRELSYSERELPPRRVLKVFMSRAAHRVPYMSSVHLLRILGVMLMTASWFLCAWTVAVLQNRDRNIPVIVSTTTARGQGFDLCYLDRWDYMMAVGEDRGRGGHLSH